MIGNDSKEVSDALAGVEHIENAPSASAFGLGVSLENITTRQHSRTGSAEVEARAAGFTASFKQMLSLKAWTGATVSERPSVAPVPAMTTRRSAASAVLGALDSKVTAYAGLLAAAAMVVLSIAGTAAWLPAAATSMGLLFLAGTIAQPSQPAGPSPELQAKVAEAAKDAANLRREIGNVIVGQQEMVDAIIMAAVTGEHVLLEGVPGVAKTQTVKAFSDGVEGNFQRIQGTPDKLPPDILGAEILQEDPATGVKSIKLEEGPVFTNILLVDEINRMMPKTQAALLEAMQERRVTIGRRTLDLPKPFLLLATQNPIEQEGTYRLPEAQQDRFMLKVIVPRPTRDQLIEIGERFSTALKPQASKVINLQRLEEIGRISEEIHVSAQLKGYIADIVEATNDPARYGLDYKEAIENGASPRAYINLLKAAKAHALLEGHAEVLRADIWAVAPLILRHRIMLSYQAQAHGITVEAIIQDILHKLPV